MLSKEIHFNETEIPNSPEYNSGYYCGYKEGLASIKNKGTIYKFTLKNTLNKDI